MYHDNLYLMLQYLPLSIYYLEMEGLFGMQSNFLVMVQNLL